MCDEIKVQLPELLTPRHRLVFTVFHVHVKRKTGGMFAKSGSVDEQVGFLNFSGLFLNAVAEVIVVVLGVGVAVVLCCWW